MFFPLQMNIFKDMLVSHGASVKALGDGRIGGYLVLFGDVKHTDASSKKDFFEAETDYDLERSTKSTVYYAHGRDQNIKQKKLAIGEMKADDVGVWIESQLDLRDRYEKAIYGLAEKGALGWSSGTATHLCVREEIKEGDEVVAHKIIKWPLGLDASLTPTPAEPRTAAVAIKELEELPTIEELLGEPIPSEEKATGKKKTPHKRIANSMANAAGHMANALAMATKGLYEDEIAARFDSIYSLCGVLECVLYRMKWMYEAATELGTTFDLNAMLSEVGTEFFARVSNVITGKDDDEDDTVSVEVDIEIGKSLDYMFNNLPQSKQADMFEQAFKDVAKRTAALNSDLKAIITRAAEKQEASEKEMPRRIRERFEDVKAGVDEVATELKSMDAAIDSLLTSPTRKALKDLSAELSQIPAPVADTTTEIM